MQFTKSFCLILTLMSINLSAHISDRVDGHAPIGVMADHTHNKGEMMASYRIMQMDMEGIINGSDDMSTEELFNNSNYMMAPVNMKMMMQMAGIMYAPSDDWTFVVMIPYTSNDMSMQSKGSMSSMDMGMSMDSMDMNHGMSSSGATMSRDSNGLGDISLSGLRKLFETEDERLLVSLGLVLPTGSETESFNGTRLAYPMQLGTGSFRFKPGITYSAYEEEFSYGAQAIVDHALNTNDQGYKVGDKYLVNLWGSYTLTEELSASLRYEYQKKNRISGMDEQINSMMMPAGNPANSGGEKHSLFTGMNYKPNNFLKGHRVAFEIGIPIKQTSDGPQMKDNYIFVLGWQKAWKQN